MQPDPPRAHAPQGYGYPSFAPARSRDTLNTGNSSGSEQWQNSTNPTSEESSLERANGITRPAPGQQYPIQNEAYGSGYSDDDYHGRGNNGYGSRQPNISQSGPVGYGGNNGYYQNPQVQGSGAIPRVPVKDSRPAPPPKNLISLSTNNVPSGAVQPPDQQRTSWFKKRFSRGK
jgi:hypothetical protein